MTDQREPWYQRVRHTAAAPTAWLRLAQILRQAAEDLWIAGNAHDEAPGSELGSTVLTHWKDPDATLPKTGGSTSDVCFMLFGFALENLAKGIIVCRDPTLVSRQSLEKWHGKGHNLAALLDWAKIEVTEDQRTLLDRTTRLTVWKGRYPVPMDFYRAGLEDPMVGYLAVTNVWPLDDYEGLSALYDKVKAVLIQTMQEVPPLPEDYQFGDP
jgi:hypothetical protein